MPITFIPIYETVLARVGLQEDDCYVLLYGSRTGADEVEIIKKPREGSVIFACASLNRLVRLFNDSQ